MWTILVFSSLIFKLLCDNHCSIWISTLSKDSLSLAVTIKSSAYLTKPSFGLIDLMCSSNPCNPIFANNGLMTPPWGVPVSVGLKIFLSINPAFNHPLISLPCGNEPIELRIVSWAMLSKKLEMSASKTHVCPPLLGWAFSLIHACCIASWLLLPHLNPYEFGSNTASHSGSSEFLTIACAILSFMVGTVQSDYTKIQ